ncbi:uncharacterized protein N7515_001099 [Penicillium bovifimosum]|uniref:Uncharacterized protein n=1 Tax=Penicillium bovifimosum TaxID=126998 RepID=A0A9W9HIS1_9EURO|nr:uncharacterized protein N7515_001099 [Penicillium bovifimosum]KAJ5146535.1 hypothetical protein N7515_001099 [Penicillium bovifimosum]
MSTTHIVKYYFYKGHMPAEPNVLKKTVALAYQTARGMQLYPRAILIRSKHHNTTTIKGKTVLDPKGWHLTFCYKDARQLRRKTHTACHGYAKDAFSWDLVESTHAGRKPDSVKARNSKYSSVWPGPEELDEAPYVRYSQYL